MWKIACLTLIYTVVALSGTLYEQFIKEQVKKVPLEKAIIVGNGEKKLITFVNPDCPHCRAEWRELRKYLKELKIYVYVYPFKAWGEDNLRKSYYIVCSEDKESALDRALRGELDGNVPEVEKCPLVDEHLRVAEMMGVDGVPYNIIPDKGKVIEGFSPYLLSELGLKK